MAGEVFLGDVAEIIMGQSPPGETYNERGDGIPFFQGVADFNYRHPTPRVYCSAPSRVARPGDIMLSVRAPIGRVNVANRECAIGRGLAIIRPKAPEDGRYLEFTLRIMEPIWMAIEGGGSVFGNATRRDLETLRVLWHESEYERRAIAHILGTLDDKIELNRRMSETLEQMARALFKSWFIDFDPVRRNAARARNQPSPGAARHPLPEGEGPYRAGYDFSGLVETARNLRRKQTPAEEIFWQLVRNRRFLDLKFRCQHQLGDYLADFYCHEHRLVVEFDGGVHKTKQKKDHKRDAWMAAQGFRVLRFPNEQLLDAPETVLSAVAAAIHHQASPPSPPGRRVGDEGSVEELDRLFPDRLVDSELGPIPEGWRVGRLGDVLVQSIDRCRPSDDTRLQPYVPIECIAARSLLLAESRPGDEAQSSLTRFRKGQILFGAMRPYFHKVAIAPFDGTTRTTVFVLRPRQPGDFSFATLLLHDAKTIEYATNHSTGSTIPYAVWQGSLASMPIVLPPMVIRKSFDQIARALIDRIPPVFFLNRTLAALRDALLPKLISGKLRVKDAERFLKERGL